MEQTFSPGALDYRVLFESAPGAFLVLTADYTIVAASDEYLKVAGRGREEIIGRDVFEVFPANPGAAAATGARNLRASLDKVRQSKKSDVLPVERYAVQPAAGGAFVEKYWEVSNSPMLDPSGAVRLITHRVEDLTDRVLAARSESERDRFVFPFR